MWTVKQNMFLILNSVPVTLVTDPEFRRPSVPVIAHFLNREVVARKAKARKCTAKIAGNVQAKVERLMTLFLSSHQPGAIPKGTPKCV